MGLPNHLHTDNTNETLSRNGINVKRVGGKYEGVLPVCLGPGRVLRDGEGEALQEAGEEGKELHFSQPFSRADVATCRKGGGTFVTENK